MKVAMLQKGPEQRCRKPMEIQTEFPFHFFSFCLSLHLSLLSLQTIYLWMLPQRLGSHHLSSSHRERATHFSEFQHQIVGNENLIGSPLVYPVPTNSNRGFVSLTQTWLPGPCHYERHSELERSSERHLL